MRYISILLLYMCCICTIQAQTDKFGEEFCAYVPEKSSRAIPNNDMSSIYGSAFTPKGDIRVLVVYVEFEGADDNDDHFINGWPVGGFPSHVSSSTGKISYLHDNLSQFVNPLGNPDPNSKRNLSEYYYHMSNGNFRLIGEALKDDSGTPVLITIDPTQANGITQLNQLVFDEINTLFPNRDWGSLGYDNRSGRPFFQEDTSTTFSNPEPDQFLDFTVIYYRNRNDWDNHPLGPGGFANIGIPGVAQASLSTQSGYDLSNGYKALVGFEYRLGAGGVNSALNIWSHELSHMYLNHPHNSTANRVFGKYLYGSKDWGMMDYGRTSSLATAWERWASGWIDIKYDLSGDNGSDNGTFQLGDYMQTGDAMRLRMPYTEDQFLWLTFRSDTDNSFYGRTIGDGQVTGSSGVTAPIPNEGLFGLTERTLRSREEISGISSRGRNGTKIMPGTGFYDYIVDSTNMASANDRLRLFVTRKKGNPFGQQGEPISFRDDFTANGTISYSTGSTNEYGFIDRRNGNGVYGRYAVNPSIPDGKYSSFTNPPITNFLEYSNSQKVLTPNILHSLSFTSQRIGDNIQISVNYDDGHIEDDFRMTGNIFLPINEHITVDPEVVLTINRSKTTNRNTPVNGDFINETVFMAAGDSSLKISDSSTMLLDEGSTTIFRADSQLSLEGNARIIVRNGALLCIQTDNVVLHPDSRIILDGGSLSISSGIDISANIENATPEITIPPSVFDNVFFCDPHPDVVNEHSIFGTTTGNDICGSDVLITDVQAVRLTSQEVVNIEPGFEVEAGGFFEANIHTIADDCTIEFFFGTDGEPVEFAGTTGTIDKKTSEEVVTLDAIVYPNPSRGNLNIEIKNAKGSFLYTLKNLSGGTLLEHHSSRSEFTMDISKLGRGVYILIVSNGKEMVSKQVVKL